jgi:hypothetical protein
LALVAPLVVSTGLFGVGVIAERSDADYGQLPAFLVLVAPVALAWAALDVREFPHQLDRSRTAIAAIAITAAVLHLAAAAVSARLARRAAGTT